jgi:hypothetical protein
MSAETLQHRLARWRVDDLLSEYSGLRLTRVANGAVHIAGVLSFLAAGPGTERIQDEYHIELTVPESFPGSLPIVRETRRRIPSDFHTLTDGGLCLGSHTRLRLLMSKDSSLVRFVEKCVIPYLYGRSYFERYGTMPFGELEHGAKGIRQDLAELFGTTRTDRMEEFARLTARKRRHANKELCPCASGLRLGRCHHRRVNALRKQLGLLWFRYVRDFLRESS